MPSEFVQLLSQPPQPLPDGTLVDTTIRLYTQTELLKIYISGIVLAIAILVITYYAYRWYSARYAAWVRKRDIEERLALGQVIEYEEEPPVQSVNTKIMFVVGAAVIIVGTVQLFL